MDIFSFLQDFSVPHYTSGYKQCRTGFVSIQCPFCQGHPFLSYHIENNYFICWACGWHAPQQTISELLHVDWKEAQVILKQYGGVSVVAPTNTIVKIRKRVFKLPSNTILLQQNHKKYLEGRRFDPDYLEKEWGLLATGPISFLKNEGKMLNYKHRIIMPFMWDNKMVTFDSRDITGKHMAKYMACPLERETIPHKEILFGKQSKWGRTGIVVEGIFDVFRFGTDAVATSGVKFMPKQVRAIAKAFKRVAVCFDGPSETSDERQAQEQAAKLVDELKFRGVDAFKIDIKGDPGSMDQKEADYLVKQIIK